MAEYTEHLNLKKPAGSENYNVSDFNNNADLIDAACGTLQASSDAFLNYMFNVAPNISTESGTFTRGAVLIGGNNRGISEVPNNNGVLIRQAGGVSPTTPYFGNVPVKFGGTGATTPAQARANLGINLANLGATPENIGAVKKSGDTMTGNLAIEKSNPTLVLQSSGSELNKRGMVQFANNVVNIWNTAAENVNDATFLALYDNTADTKDILKVTKRVNGTNSSYFLFGQHNLEYLLAAIQNFINDGSLSMVKSVQRGTVASGLEASGTITIAAVNTGKSVAILGGTVGGMGGPVQIELTNSTTVTWKRSRVYGAATGTDMSGFSWQVIEYR